MFCHPWYTMHCKIIASCSFKYSHRFFFSKLISCSNGLSTYEITLSVLGVKMASRFDYKGWYTLLYVVRMHSSCSDRISDAFTQGRKVKCME